MNQAIMIMAEAAKISPTVAAKAYEALVAKGYFISRADESKVAGIMRLIRITLDSPTFIDPAANCRNLTKTLQEIEAICGKK